MIRVSMVLHSGVTGKRTSLAELLIVNDGSGTVSRGNYNYAVMGRTGRELKRGHVNNWPRQSKTALALLQRVINDAYPKGSK